MNNLVVIKNITSFNFYYHNISSIEKDFFILYRMGLFYSVCPKLRNNGNDEVA